MIIDQRTFLPSNSDVAEHYQDTVFRGCTFRDGAILHWTFRGCTFHDCRFEAFQTPRCEFDDCLFANCTFERSSIRKTRLKGVKFASCRFDDCSFHRTYVEIGVSFVHCSFVGIEFDLYYAERFRFERCEFSRLVVDMRGSWDIRWEYSNSIAFALLMADGLESCVDRDGSLGDAISSLYLSIDEVESYLQRRASPTHAIAASIDSIRRTFEGLYGRLKAPDPSDDATARLIAPVSESLIELVNRDPVAMHRITPRQFEELVASLMERMGFVVELTGCTRDGGYDILAIKRDLAGFSTSWLVECKRYAPERKVGLAVVRSLWTLRASEQRGGCLVATTSSFSADVLSYQKSRYDLNLADNSRIIEWCRIHARR